MMTKFETNHDYGFNDEIENKSKFKKKTLRAKLEIKTMRIKVKILVNERTTLRF
jgi:hypothetical protein